MCVCVCACGCAPRQRATPARGAGRAEITPAGGSKECASPHCAGRASNYLRPSVFNASGAPHRCPPAQSLQLCVPIHNCMSTQASLRWSSPKANGEGAPAHSTGPHALATMLSTRRTTAGTPGSPHDPVGSNGAKRNLSHRSSTVVTWCPSRRKVVHSTATLTILYSGVADVTVQRHWSHHHVHEPTRCTIHADQPCPSAAW